jgi:hypothetical protein
MNNIVMKKMSRHEPDGNSLQRHLIFGHELLAGGGADLLNKIAQLVHADAWILLSPTDSGSHLGPKAFRRIQEPSKKIVIPIQADGTPRRQLSLTRQDIILTSSKISSLMEILRATTSRLHQLHLFSDLPLPQGVHHVRNLAEMDLLISHAGVQTSYSVGKLLHRREPLTIPLKRGGNSHGVPGSPFGKGSNGGTSQGDRQSVYRSHDREKDARHHGKSKQLPTRHTGSSGYRVQLTGGAYLLGEIGEIDLG